MKSDDGGDEMHHRISTTLTPLKPSLGSRDGRSAWCAAESNGEGLQKQDPVSPMLDKKKLELDKDQVAQLTTVGAKRNDAIAVLKEPQKKKAYDVFEKQLEQSDELMREPGRGGVAWVAVAASAADLLPNAGERTEARTGERRYCGNCGNCGKTRNGTSTQITQIRPLRGRRRWA